MMSPDDPRHGTYAGYRAHTRSNVPPCEPCKESRREFERSKRKVTGRRRGARTIAEKAAREDIDWVVVHRIMDGNNCPANTAERLEVVRLWQNTGRTWADLEDITGWRTDRYTRVLRDSQQVAS